MRRLCLVAALLLVLTVPCVWAQRRGGASFGGGAHFGSASHGPAMVSHGGSFAGARPGYHTSITSSWGNPYHYAHGGNGWGYGYRHRRYYGAYGYGYGYGYPYWGLYGYDPFLWGDADYDSEQYDQQNQQAAALSEQVNELGNELARVREEQQIRAYTPLPTDRQVPASAAKPDVSDPTVLVFRDQHREEIKNYAVVGHTLWVFNQDRAKKIPLADLDVPATIKVNDDRGVDFSVPR